MRNTLIFSIILLCCIGCHRQPEYRIGVSQCLDDAWRQKMNEEMERELLLHPDMSLYKRIAYGSNELQCAQIDSFISERVNLLIVSPNEAEEVKPGVTGDEWTAFIGGDNYRVGELMAEWVATVQSENSQAGKHGSLHVLEVAGLPGSTPAEIGRSRDHAVLVSEVIADWERDSGFSLSEKLISAGATAIFAQNDLMAIGASEAVRDNSSYGAGSVRIMGVDGIMPGLQAIIDGVIECTATYLSRGDMVIETAANILAGEPFVRDTVIETTMINAIAAHALLMQHEARLHDLQTLHIVQLRSDNLWQQMRSDRRRLITIIVFFFLLLVVAIAALLYMLTHLKTEIRRDILPQLEEVEQTLETIQLSQRDMAFGERMKQIVDDHLTDPNLNVEFLSSSLRLSRTQIFRRVKTVAGKGPLEFIRERRLLRADELLRTTDMTVQQVALELCFSSPGYFTKCYKDYFGHLPSERK